ncbi:MAG: DUF6168 family protein [Bacteroidota bacterium]
MQKHHLPFQFFMLLLLALLLAFGVHTFVLSNKELPIFDNLIVRSYLVNGVLAALIFGVLYQFRKKLKNQIGFLFMGGSLLKFVFFFLMFYPVYKGDGDMSRLEFAAFFVPYATALFLETYYIAKMLKSLEKATKK